MEEKYYIDIDKNRKIIGRYLKSIHGENIPISAQEVSQEVFETSIQENHNYLSEDLTTCIKEKTEKEIAKEEAEATVREEILQAEKDAEFLEQATKWGLI